MAARRPSAQAGVEAVSRKLLPRSLLGRSLLIILVPLVLVQMVALVIFYGTHLNNVSRRLSGAVAGELALSARMIEAAPDRATRNRIIGDAGGYFDLQLSYEDGAHLRGVSSPNVLGPMDDDLTAALTMRVSRHIVTNWQKDPLSVLIDMQLPQGVLHAAVPRKRLYTNTIYLFVIWLAGSAMLLFGVASLFMRNQVRAIRRLAIAVEDFGLGRDTGPIRPEGAAEVRRAASAFNRMQDRIRRFMAQRTEMLAGVSHDLRTPLTRMKLALAMLPEETRKDADIKEVTADIEEMESMIEAYLAFARGEQAEEAETCDITLLLNEIAAAAARMGGNVSVVSTTSLHAHLRPGAMRRALANLVENATRHASHVQLDSCLSGRNVNIFVDDDGPGIEPGRRESVFRPFETGAVGGTGLGLTIARDILRAHGGDILLETSKLGGLRARVVLPQ